MAGYYYVTLTSEDIIKQNDDDDVEDCSRTSGLAGLWLPFRSVRTLSAHGLLQVCRTGLRDNVPADLLPRWQKVRQSRATQPRCTDVQIWVTNSAVEPNFWDSDSFHLKCHGRQLAPNRCKLDGGSVWDVVVHPRRPTGLLAGSAVNSEHPTATYLCLAEQSSTSGLAGLWLPFRSVRTLSAALLVVCRIRRTKP